MYESLYERAIMPFRDSRHIRVLFKLIVRASNTDV